MAGIYIPSMEIPSDGQTDQIFIDGRGWAYYSLQDAINDTNRVAQVIPVPDHGDLIGRDYMHEMLNWTLFKPPFSRKSIRQMIDAVPTIIPASKEEQT